MEPNDKENTSFGSFLESYKSRTYQSNIQHIQFKITTMQKLLGDLISRLQNDASPNSEMILLATEAKDGLNLSMQADPQVMLIEFGKKFTRFLRVVKRLNIPENDMIHEISHAITYEMADLAKSIDDPALISVALGLGEELF